MSVERRIAYIATDDEPLGRNLSKIIECTGVRAHWFRSAAGYLAHQRPDLVSCLFLGCRLSDMSGYELQSALRDTIGPPIVMLSEVGDIPSCVRAIKGGAHDFLSLPFTSSHLLMVMESAFREDQAGLTVRREEEELRNRWRSLTSREAEVMRYVVRGFLNKQTAAELRIAENTVQVHRARVMRKMGADSFASLVRMSLRLVERGENALLQTEAQQYSLRPLAFVSERIPLSFQ